MIEVKSVYLLPDSQRDQGRQIGEVAEEKSLWGGYVLCLNIHYIFPSFILFSFGWVKLSLLCVMLNVVCCNCNVSMVAERMYNEMMLNDAYYAWEGMWSPAHEFLSKIWLT